MPTTNTTIITRAPLQVAESVSKSARLAATPHSMNVSGTGYVRCKGCRDHPYSCAYNISDYASTINNNDQPAWMELGYKERKEKDILWASLAWWEPSGDEWRGLNLLP
ncbi:hypothetical protein PAAG_07121 [Paracoccidioides lutzii Pb01]|uniref:Uncharacterized protein n=1 Tax=Paracoccidioides lutzii (strain ATCC MYA-826 / Pb01) TaxID=502779 RepID=C1H8N0_PARBA|nr:hypothetical protein PAAG_07121 [Paracoccidioides lutzii Pb01]EEH36703.1 hypothetical protein PAAG_07121 [Paracoccidioides lutzii Pb01]